MEHQVINVEWFQQDTHSLSRHCVSPQCIVLIIPHLVPFLPLPSMSSQHIPSRKQLLLIDIFSFLKSCLMYHLCARKGSCQVYTSPFGTISNSPKLFSETVAPVCGRRRVII